MAASRRPRNAHDRIVKRVFSRKSAFAVELRRVLPSELLAHLDLRTLAHHSTERTNEHLRGHIADLCYTAQFSDRERLPAYFPLEHYSTPPTLFPLRALTCASAIWHEHAADHPHTTLLPLVALLVFTQPLARNTPTQLSRIIDIPAALRDVVPSPIEVRAYVDDLSGSVLDDPVADSATLALVELTRAFLHAHANPASLTTRRLAALAPLFDVLLDQPEPLATHDVRALLTYVLSAFPNGSPVRALVRSAIRGRSRAMFVSIADSLVAKGERRGLAKGERRGLAKGERKGLAKGERRGLVKGRTAGLASAVLWLLEHRFSSVPRAIRRRVAASVDERELRRWLERAAAASSVAEVFDDDDE